jgi:hypothetical protein
MDFFFLEMNQSETRIACGGHGRIYARSSIKHLHLVPFVQQIWPPRAILFSDWPIFKNLLQNCLAK